MSKETVDLTPLRYDRWVRGDVTETFDRFTAGIARWWPRHHKVGKSEIALLVIEPHLTGVIKERGDDGLETVWGRVTKFNRPGRFAFVWTCDTFWKGTETVVRFVQAEPERVRIELEHGRLASISGHVDQLRASFGSPTGWREILDAFVTSMERI